MSEDDETNQLYLNDRNGRFSGASVRIPVGGVSNVLAVMDLGGDGSSDLLIGNNGTDRAIMNDGGARFSDESSARWSNNAPTQDLELVDVDGGGDLDVAVADLNADGDQGLFLCNRSSARAPEAAARASGQARLLLRRPPPRS